MRYIFEKGMRSDTKFKKKLGIKEARDMQDLLSRAQNYINYEKQMLGEKAEKAKTPPRKDTKAREDRTERRLPRAHPSKHIKREDTPRVPQHRVRRCRDPSTHENKRKVRNGQKQILQRSQECRPRY
jgi:hypothetical protein